MEEPARTQVENREPTRGVVLQRYQIVIPVVISILSVGFGIFQYLDKRELEQHGLRKAQLDDHAGLQVNRLMLKCGDVLRSQSPTNAESWNRGLARFIAHVESVVPYQDLRLIEDDNYGQLAAYIDGALAQLRAGTFADSGIENLERFDRAYVRTISESEQLYHILGDEKLEFVVLGNTGGSVASEICGRDPDGEELFRISALEPGASLLHVSALDGRLKLKDMGWAEYTDEFTGDKKEVLAWKGLTATTIAPNIGWGD